MELEEAIRTYNLFEDSPKIRQFEEARHFLLEEENKKHTIKLTDEEYRKVIENAQRDIKKQFEQKVKDLIENETINISGFECIAVEDLEELLEEK